MTKTKKNSQRQTCIEVRKKTEQICFYSKLDRLLSKRKLNCWELLTLSSHVQN